MLLVEIVHNVEELRPDRVVPEEVPASAVEPLVETARAPLAPECPAVGVLGVHQEVASLHGVDDAPDPLAVEFKPGADRHRHHLGRVGGYGKDSRFLHGTPSSNFVAAVDLEGSGDGLALQDEHDVGDRLVLAVLADVLGQPIQVFVGRLELVRALEHPIVLVIEASGVEVVVDASGLHGVVGPATGGLDFFFMVSYPFRRCNGVVWFSAFWGLVGGYSLQFSLAVFHQSLRL